MLETSSPIDTQIPVTNAESVSEYYVIRRNGKRTPFDKNKISIALTKAFLAVEGAQAEGSNRIHQAVESLSDQVMAALIRHLPVDGVMHIEHIQDQVELALMRNGDHQVARAYVLYRAEQAKKREAASSKTQTKKNNETRQIIQPDGSKQTFDLDKAQASLLAATVDIKDVHVEPILKQVVSNIYDGMSLNDLNQVMVLAARGLIDQEPNYSQVAARLLLNNLEIEALSFVYGSATTRAGKARSNLYQEYFPQYIQTASDLKLLDTELCLYDLTKLASAIKPARDMNFNYLGLQTLYDRYFIHSGEARLELPQAFFMRVAMGLAINEIDREARAIEFYEVLSSFDFMSSTPTLFNSGTLRPQLSSCYLTTVPDNLKGIYGGLTDNAMLSKFAGGLGNDWTRVRGMGAFIEGTNGNSQGVIPFLKVANDTAVAVNQGGKRKGAVCAYLETWHIDIEDFLELRKNTGDERRRTHDMNTANWIPDLFMQRVAEDKEWTLFSPDETPELHDLYGQAFKQAYETYEEKADAGDIKLFRRVKAVELWRKMIGMLFETGHPWITFKDPCNIRYTNQHQGVVHSSNLCTEITLAHQRSRNRCL